MKNFRESFRPSLFIVILVLLFHVYPIHAAGETLPQPQQLQNLQTFARLYGYVRYFYPGTEAAETDWTGFAIYGAKRVENAANSQELKKILEELFLPIAPPLVLQNNNQKKPFQVASITPPSIEGKKVTSWQHHGVGLDPMTDIRSLYKSVRLNTMTLPRNRGTFATLTTSTDAPPLRDKEFKLQAAVKVIKGKGQLWLRVDRPNKQMGFFDNMDSRPITDSNWTYYEIIGSVATDAIAINFGCLLDGQGEIMVDDFLCFVRDKGAAEWVPVKLTNPDFEADTLGNHPANWRGGSEGYTIAVTAESAAKGNNSVKIQSVPPVEVAVEELFPNQVTVGEHIDKEIGSGLSCLMPLALYIENLRTYPSAPAAPLAALTAAIKAEDWEKQTATNRYVRLGATILVWNNFQHFFPYFDVVKTNWMAELPKLLQAAYQDKTPIDFRDTLRKCTAMLKDGHVNVRLTGDMSMSYRPAFEWDWAEGQLVISYILDKPIPGIEVGDVVLEIDGTPIAEAIKREKMFISAATPGWMDYRLKSALAVGPEDSVITLKLKRAGQILTTQVPRTLDMGGYFQLKPKRTPSGKLEEGLYYLDLDKMSMPEITALMPELEKATTIICDLRGYPNGNHDLISHLLKENDTASAWMWTPQIVYPDFEKVTYRKSGWMMETLKPHLNAKIIFIVDGRAISYAESYMGLIEYYKLATIIGQPTAGTNGNVNLLSLPGGYRISWTGMRVIKEDGSPHHGVGIIPHVLLERTIKGIKEGRDEFLEKAIKIN